MSLANVGGRQRGTWPLVNGQSGLFLAIIILYCPTTLCYGQPAAIISAQLETTAMSNPKNTNAEQIVAPGTELRAHLPPVRPNGDKIPTDLNHEHLITGSANMQKAATETYYVIPQAVDERPRGARTLVSEDQYGSTPASGYERLDEQVELTLLAPACNLVAANVSQNLEAESHDVKQMGELVVDGKALAESWAGDVWPPWRRRGRRRRIKGNPLDGGQPSDDSDLAADENRTMGASRAEWLLDWRLGGAAAKEARVALGDNGAVGSGGVAYRKREAQGAVEESSGAAHVVSDKSSNAASAYDCSGHRVDSEGGRWRRSRTKRSLRSRAKLGSGGRKVMRKITPTRVLVGAHVGSWAYKQYSNWTTTTQNGTLVRVVGPRPLDNQTETAFNSSGSLRATPPLALKRVELAPLPAANSTRADVTAPPATTTTPTLSLEEPQSGGTAVTTRTPSPVESANT